MRIVADKTARTVALPPQRAAESVVANRLMPKPAPGAALEERRGAPVRRPRRERNQVLALALASVAASVFGTVVMVTMLLHYAEAHHAIANF